MIVIQITTCVWAHIIQWSAPNLGYMAYSYFQTKHLQVCFSAASLCFWCPLLMQINFSVLAKDWHELINSAIVLSQSESIHYAELFATSPLLLLSCHHYGHWLRGWQGPKGMLTGATDSFYHVYIKIVLTVFTKRHHYLLPKTCKCDVR